MLVERHPVNHDKGRVVNHPLIHHKGDQVPKLANAAAVVNEYLLHAEVTQIAFESALDALEAWFGCVTLLFR